MEKIQNISDFISMCVNSHYKISSEIQEGRVFHISSPNGNNISVKWKEKKQGGKTSYVGLYIRKPYYLLGKFDRANSGQINITFGKSKTSDVNQMIKDLLVQDAEYQQQKESSFKKSTEIASFLQEVIKKNGFYNQAIIQFPYNSTLYGFSVKLNSNIPLDCELAIELQQMGCEELFYSYDSKGFILCPSVLPNGGIKRDSSNRTPLDIQGFNKFAEKVQKIDNLINKINEKYFGK